MKMLTNFTTLKEWTTEGGIFNLAQEREIILPNGKELYLIYNDTSCRDFGTRIYIELGEKNGGIILQKYYNTVWKRYFDGLGLNAWLGKRGGLGVCLLGGKYANAKYASKNIKLLKACKQAFFLLY